MDQVWRRCSSCKNNLPFSGMHWVCNVSTCNRPRLFLTFCSVSCWDAHLASVRHRDTWAEERKSPSEELWKKVLAGEENWPPRAAKEKPAAAPAPKVSTGPKTVIRRKASE
ncbi:MAG: hypothetical protein EOP11_09990 [Proteobacteria bacterium]|nr:MAG: hypothetical protein EOP11_09990 [Pseudomonadota bacterium]